MDASGDKNLTPTKRPRSAVEMTLYGSLLAIVFLAYLVPLDVLQKYPQFVPFVDFMASWNTQIRRVGEISGPRSQVNMFIYSVTWCLICVPIGCQIRISIAKWGKNDLPAIGYPMIWLLALIFFGAIVIWFTYTWPGVHWSLESRLGRAIFVSPLTSPAWSVGIVFAFWFSLIASITVLLVIIWRFCGWRR